MQTAGCKLHRPGLEMTTNLTVMEAVKGDRNGTQGYARERDSSLLAAPTLFAPVMTVGEVF